jgi:hypothetical protein
MSLSATLEVVLGLSFLFAILSLVASGINELIAAAFKLRAKTLEQGVQNLLADPAEAQAIYDHPLIQSLYRSNRLPSYIPRDKFALALIDNKINVALTATRGQINDVEAAIQNLPDGRVKKTFDVLWREARGDANRFRRNVERWFDDGMERVSGWYRRLTQAILLSLGVVIALALNVNTITVTQRLWSDAPLRTAIVKEAQEAVPPPAADQQGVKDALTNVQSGLSAISGLSLPIGWGKTNRPDSAGSWVIALVGWLLTAVALSMGAPFWFDLLGRVARLRSSGVRPPTSLPPSAEAEPVDGDEVQAGS